MLRIDIINRELTELKTKKTTAVGAVLRAINRRIVSMENVLLREMNYPPVSESPIQAIGIKGDKGENGEPGKDGIDGEKGDRGLQGEQGIKGDTGTNGIDGQNGLKGDKGEQGEKGLDGVNGIDGSQGLKGDKGDKGEKGESGENGLQGLKGDKGDSGTNGLDGANGSKGDQGANGLDGLNGLNGEKGDIGLMGPVGEKGAKGDIGLSGEQGTQGIQGIQGIQGLQGVKGFDARLLSGKILFPDVQFENGLNGIQVYDNSLSGITHTRIPSPAGTPKGTGHVIEIKHLSSEYGGFYPVTVNTRLNALFIQKFKAKIPVGCTIQTASNVIGDDGSITWMSGNVGTGKWEDYIVKIQSGSTGSFSTAGHIGLIFNGTIPTPQAPLIWYLSDATVYDVDAVVPEFANRVIGEVKSFAGVNAPSNHLLCQGQSLLVTEYPELFASMANMYGGDGIVNFMIPDLRGKTILGASISFPLGQKGGNSSVTLISQNLPAHTHMMTASADSPTVATAEGSSLSTQGRGGNTMPVIYSTGATNQVNMGSSTGSTGSGLPIDVLNPYVSMNFIICVR